ncbi:hypothetical protein GCM10007916_21120 [Psychromonas marina]|uniref:Uncharacterized protein n=1 Tax=Psychromonas marina TaxID=88364 RepID=A0ABQ6E1C3_9GAMM|nr:hypothetical protein [Psychromonas marina]GLS91044.1 hypothetical protein GCM10007916_21120 [Psychromonas marina]
MGSGIVFCINFKLPDVVLLSIVAKQYFIVDRYVDDAIGVMGKDSDGKVSLTKVTLRHGVYFQEKTADDSTVRSVASSSP